MTNKSVEIIEVLLNYTGAGFFIALLIFALMVLIIRSRSIRKLIFTHVQLVLGISFLLLFIWGVFSLYTPINGFPGWSEKSHGISMGGKVGETIVSSNLIIGYIRLIAIFVLAITIIKPLLILKILKFTLHLVDLNIHLIKESVYRLSNLYRSNEILASEYKTTIKESITENNISISNHVNSEDSHKTIPDNDIKGIGDFIANRNDDNNENSAIKLKPETSMTTKNTDTSQTSPRLFEIPSNASHKYDTYNKYWSEKVKHDTSEHLKSEKLDSFSKTILQKWKLPALNILSDAIEGGISDEEIETTSKIIKDTFAEYKVEIAVEKVRPGPTVTMYGIQPGWVRKSAKNLRNDAQNEFSITNLDDKKTRVTVDNILRREKDLSLALKTPSLRIETPVMGESLLGIEVPNPNPSLVTLRMVMNTSAHKKASADGPLPIALGKGSDGNEIVFDLSKMPHLLIAGATGSGKSVCINAIISCLLMERTPEELQMILVDPKRVELTPYNGIPHLITPVIVETDQVVNSLKGLIREMMDRFRRMEEVSARNIDSFNKKSSEKLPYIVVAIDELADLMMTAAYDVEQSICRLAQLGRATGIHLIIATQRPSVDVITGLIKANFPSRISFAVTSQIDSRTIIDIAGAEKLLGRGDMLYQPIDATRPARVQNVYIGDEEINKLVAHWKTTPQAPKPIVDIHTFGDISQNKNNSVIGEDNLHRDKLMNDAINVAKLNVKLSTSLLQRRLRIGYPRAARLMDELEDMGIVGPSDGSKSRDVLTTTVRDL